jgi:hypothetical protein
MNVATGMAEPLPPELYAQALAQMSQMQAGGQPASYGPGQGAGAPGQAYPHGYGGVGPGASPQ